MQDFDLGWAVGLFEGEGTIVLPSVGRGSIQLQLASTDEDTVVRFQALVGGKVYGPYGPYQPNRKAHWRWDAYGDNAAEFLRLVFPYLGSRRALRAREALDRYEARQTEPYYSVSRKGMGGKPTHINGAEYVYEQQGRL